MAITVKYRIRAPHEVTIISPRGQQFAILFPNIYAQADDPTFPDGMELYQELSDGTLDETAALGFAKIYDAASHSVRNALQDEIDVYDASRSADDAALQQASAVTLLTLDPVWSVLFRAVIEEIYIWVMSKDKDQLTVEELIQAAVTRLQTGA